MNWFLFSFLSLLASFFAGNFNEILADGTFWWYPQPLYKILVEDFIVAPPPSALLSIRAVQNLDKMTLCFFDLLPVEYCIDCLFLCLIILLLNIKSTLNRPKDLFTSAVQNVWFPQFYFTAAYESCKMPTRHFSLRS